MRNIIIIRQMIPDFEQLCKIFIRPQRHRYRLSDLGSKNFQLNGHRIFRQDFQLKNTEQLNLECSLYSTHRNTSEITKAILYLHCNSGCRLQGQSYLKEAVTAGFSLVLFDFAGSGNSEGEYVTLGYREAGDIAIIVAYLKQLNPNMTICLWGRSMGAVAALSYLKKDSESVAMAVYDSPFSSLRELALDVGNQKTKIPKFLLKMFIDRIKTMIEEKAKFSIDALQVAEDIDKITVPGVFIGSTNDQLVPFSHVQSLFQQYPAKKELFVIQQEHNEARSKHSIDKIFKSINRYMLASQTQTLLQTETDEAVGKGRKKLNLTLKCYSQKDLNYHKKDSYFHHNTLKKQVEAKTKKHLTSVNLFIKEKFEKSPTKQPPQQKPQKHTAAQKTRQKRPTRQFKSQAIKNQIMKANLSSDSVAQKRTTHTIVKPQQLKFRQPPQGLKSRNTIHHLLSVQQQSDINYSFKRISFNRMTNKQN